MKKTFDAVAFQRKIREQLSQQYRANREQFVRALRQKYDHLRTQRADQRGR